MMHNNDVFAEAFASLGKEVFTDNEAFTDFCSIMMEMVEHHEGADQFVRVVMIGAIPVLLEKIIPYIRKTKPELEAQFAESIRQAVFKWIEHVRNKAILNNLSVNEEGSLEVLSNDKFGIQ